MSLSHEIMRVNLATNEAVYGTVTDAVIRPDGSLAIDCTFGSEFYIVSLAPKEGTSDFIGEFQKGKMSTGVSGKVTATRYDNSEALVLRGDWIEDGDTYMWVAAIKKSRLRE
jgi:hypothetical protein